MESFDETDLKFKIPGGMIIAGPSSSGKSTLVMRLLENAEEMFDPPPAEIVYAYGQYHSLSQFKTVAFGFTQASHRMIIWLRVKNLCSW